MFQQSLWAIAAALCFSLMGACVKLSTVGLSTFELVFYRSLISAVVIALIAMSRGQSLKTDHLKYHIIRSVLGVLSIALWFYALGLMDFASCMTLIYTTPLFMAANFFVLAKLKGENSPWGLTASIIAGFSGVVLVLRPGYGSDDLIPALICLSVAAIDLVSYWQMKKMGKLKEPSYRIVFYFSVIGVVFAGLATVGTGGFHILTLQSLLGIIGMGLAGLLGQLCTTRSYAYGNMLLSSCLGFMAIPFSVVIGLVLFDDWIDMVTIAGMLLVITAGVNAVIVTRRMQEKESV